MNELPTYIPPPLPVKSQQEVDADQLGMVVIGHYIIGAMVALSSCMALIYIAFGIVMIHNPHVFNPPPPPPKPGQPAEQPFPFNPGYFVVAFGTLAIFLGWTYAALNALAGKYIAKRKHYVFVMIVTGLGCATMSPISTTLGILSFIVLLRPTVKALFEQNPATSTVATRQ